jgi:hypothetical protein
MDMMVLIGLLLLLKMWLLLMSERKEGLIEERRGQCQRR